MMELPWIEKYRPKSIEDIVGNENIVEKLKVIGMEGNMPHLMLTGPPGVGKTSSISCLAHQLLGDAYPDAVLELNASDERGIEVIRGSIKSFASKKVTLPIGRHKIIILDEADSMTPGAQQALRRIMEMHSSTTRFALACNTSSKIIEPIQSRCSILRYSKPSNDQIAIRIKQICSAEGIPCNDGGMEALLFSADGDIRQAINNLQATSTAFSFISQDNVNKVCDLPQQSKLLDLIDQCKNSSMDGAQSHLESLLETFSPLDIVIALFRVVKYLEKDYLGEALQLEYIRLIGRAHVRIIEGLSTKLQLCSLLSDLTSLKEN